MGSVSFIKLSEHTIGAFTVWDTQSMCTHTSRFTGCQKQINCITEVWKKNETLTDENTIRTHCHYFYVKHWDKITASNYAVTKSIKTCSVLCLTKILTVFTHVPCTLSSTVDLERALVAIIY